MYSRPALKLKPRRDNTFSASRLVSENSEVFRKPEPGTQIQYEAISSAVQSCRSLRGSEAEPTTSSRYSSFRGCERSLDRERTFFKELSNWHIYTSTGILMTRSFHHYPLQHWDILLLSHLTFGYSIIIPLNIGMFHYYPLQHWDIPLLSHSTLGYSIIIPLNSLSWNVSQGNLLVDTHLLFK